MTEDLQQEREEWEALLGSGGWARFVAHVEQQWTGAEAFKQRVTAAVHGGKTDATDAVNQIVAVSGAMGVLLAHPKARLAVIADLERRERQTNQGRRRS